MDIDKLLAIDRFFRCLSPRKGLYRETYCPQIADGDALPCIVIGPTDTGSTKTTTKRLPAVVYYHGGGYTLTYMSMHIKLCELALAAGCVVVAAVGAIKAGQARHVMCFRTAYEAAVLARPDDYAITARSSTTNNICTTHFFSARYLAKASYP